jgi:hypothetical protein
MKKSKLCMVAEAGAALGFELGFGHAIALLKGFSKDTDNVEMAKTSEFLQNGCAVLIQSAACGEHRSGLIGHIKAKPGAFLTFGNRARVCPVAARPRCTISMP